MLIETVIVKKLTEQFAPQTLHIENESHRHSAGRGAESHFKVTMVSEKFADKRPVARHQAVYQVLSEELANGVHALALHLYTPEEWAAQGQKIPESTHCVGYGH